MFGYVVVNQSEMKFKEYDVYRSYYCGLCQSLKERYGVLGQLSLNYDMTFILMLLTGLYEPKEQEDQCRCVAHPLEKHATRRNLFTDYVADMTVLFACYKAEDDWEDENSLRGLVYGLEKLWRRSYPAARMSGRIIWRDWDFSSENLSTCWMPTRTLNRISKKEPTIR